MSKQTLPIISDPAGTLGSETHDFITGKVQHLGLTNDQIIRLARIVSRCAEIELHNILEHEE